MQKTSVRRVKFTLTDNQRCGRHSPARFHCCLMETPETQHCFFLFFFPLLERPTVKPIQKTILSNSFRECLIDAITYCIWGDLTFY